MESDWATPIKKSIKGITAEQKKKIRESNKGHFFFLHVAINEDIKAVINEPK